jgi:hypothetical protein
MEICLENFLLCASDRQKYGKKKIQENKRSVQTFKIFMYRQSPCVRV